MGASDFSKLPHIGESLKRKEDYRFLTGAGQYTDDVVLAAHHGSADKGKEPAPVRERREQNEHQAAHDLALHQAR